MVIRDFNNAPEEWTSRIVADLPANSPAEEPYALSMKVQLP